MSTIIHYLSLIFIFIGLCTFIYGFFKGFRYMGKGIKWVIIGGILYILTGAHFYHGL